VPDLREAVESLGEDLEPPSLGVNDATSVHIGNRAIGPVDQLVAIFEREVE